MVSVDRKKLTEGWSGELLLKMPAQATAQAVAEAATQGDESAVAVKEATCANGGSWEDLNHIDKNRPSEMEWMVVPKPRLREWMLLVKRRKRIVPKLHRLLECSMKTRGTIPGLMPTCSVRLRFCNVN